MLGQNRRGFWKYILLFTGVHRTGPRRLERVAGGGGYRPPRFRQVSPDRPPRLCFAFAGTPRTLNRIKIPLPRRTYDSEFVPIKGVEPRKLIEYNFLRIYTHVFRSFRRITHARHSGRMCVCAWALVCENGEPGVLAKSTACVAYVRS